MSIIEFSYQELEKILAKLRNIPAEQWRKMNVPNEDPDEVWWKDYYSTILAGVEVRLWHAERTIITGRQYWLSLYEDNDKAFARSPTASYDQHPPAMGPYERLKKLYIEIGKKRANMFSEIMEKEIVEEKKKAQEEAKRKYHDNSRKLSGLLDRIDTDDSG
ncbi:hypothetical protein ACFL0V_05755 [Nanoarchaeota archaeon]